MLILFYIALAGILHTYFLYPLFLHLIGLFSKKTESTSLPDLKSFPSVEIIFAAYNEEVVIEEKIRRSFKTSYPPENLSICVGSDNSSDQTTPILQRLQNEYPRLYFKNFETRTGKSGILNELVKESKADLLILTDANILFEKNTIPNLVAALQDEKAGIAGGHILYAKVNNRGISRQESLYLKWENSIKTLESRLFGAAMGAEGGCYIIRRELFPGIPPLYYMEDFYITMSVLAQGKKVKFIPEAHCFEDVSVHSQEEFKRKVRISIGNFQNLFTFGKMIFSRFFPVGFVFLSHKVLRWLTPFFLIILLITSIYLALGDPFYGIFAGIYMIFIAAGLFGIIFSNSRAIGWFKYPGHFIYMNLALFKGFIIYLKGVESNAWQPTRRNQE